MSKLTEMLLTEENKPKVVADARRLLEAEVARKGGISGFAVKAGYKVVKTFKPGFLDRVLADLLPDFCDALDPLHERYLTEKKGTFGAHMRSHSEDVTRALLSVTDGRAAQSQNRVVKGTYSKLRGSAESNVREAVPRLADLLDQYYPKEAATPAP